MHEELLGYFNTKLELPAKCLTYNDGGGGSIRLRQAMCQFLNRHLHPVTPLETDQVVVTNGVSSAIEHFSWALADPTEGILLGRPFYGSFVPDISQRPLSKVIPVNFDGVDPFSIEAVSRYEEALLAFQQSTGSAVRALMLCNPHNPLGRCYSRLVLVALMQLCEKYHMHLVSDEVYALSVWRNTVDQKPRPVSFTSVLSIDMTGVIDPRFVHVLWGLSKDFGANGIRLGVIISQANRDLHLALKGLSLYSYPSAISGHLASLLLEDFDFTEDYIQQNQKKLSDSHAYAAEMARLHGIEYAPGANAAFFLWFNLGKRYRELHREVSKDDVVEEIIMQNLLKRKVFLARGTVFGSGEDGWFRMVFSQPREYLKEAFKRIIEALEESTV